MNLSLKELVMLVNSINYHILYIKCQKLHFRQFLPYTKKLYKQSNSHKQ